MGKRQPESSNLLESRIQIVEDSSRDQEMTFRIKVRDVQIVACKEPRGNEGKQGRAAKNDEEIRKGLAVYKIKDFGQSSFEL